MTLRARILVALGTLAVAPVLVLGWLSYRVNRAELLQTARRSQSRAATQLARSCESFVLDRAQALQLSSTYIPFRRLSPRELGAVLAIPYRQIPEVAVLAAFDRAGTAIAEPVLERGGDPHPTQRGREPVTDRDLELFARSVPLEAALASQIAVGPPYRAPSSGVPRVVIAVRAGEDSRVVAAELSLAELDRRLRDVAAEEGAAFLVDGVGAPFTSAIPSLKPEERDLVLAGRLKPGGLTRAIRRADGERWLASYAPVELLGWGVVVAQPVAVAFRAADRIRRYMLFWAAAALVLTILLGTFLARSLATPVANLSAAAQALTEGRYDAAVDEGRRDELGRLGAAFNHMAREVRRRDEEIRGWNSELQRRVDERTAELRAAQDQIARARRLAALGSLGAGVAHGLNNPMTSIVGLVSLARAQVGPSSPPGELLGTAIDEARRITRIVEDLKRLTEQERGDGGQRFALQQPVRAALEKRRPRLDEGGIALTAEVDAALPPVQGDPGQIEELVGHLVDNAAEAMPGGGRLEVTLSAIEGDALKLSVADTGKGVASEIRERIFDPFFSTKAKSGAGLGLSLCNAIVEAHHGRIVVDSIAGRGARVTVLLPVAPRSAHLI